MIVPADLFLRQARRRVLVPAVRAAVVPWRRNGRAKLALRLLHHIVFLAPAGLPLQKPITASIVDFLRQVARGIYPRDAAARALAAVARAPRAAFALAEEVRALDLRRECDRVRAAGIPVLVIGCSSDTLVTRGHSQALADALGADYRELTLGGGHMWMLHAHELLARVLS